MIWIRNFRNPMKKISATFNMGLLLPSSCTIQMAYRQLRPLEIQFPHINRFQISEMIWFVIMSDSQNDNCIPGSLLNIIRPDWLTRSGTNYSIDSLSIRFHLEFKCKVNRLIKPSDQEYLYFRVIRDQEVTTNYHLDSLASHKKA